MKSDMRYLNKIIFINSAAIKYAEINLDGNVHLIGTQGVGKSTLLRSILFFYNADTLKLGIPVSKKSFAEHYFNFANSFIVYEIARETGTFCVMAFKSQGRVSYRFIDCNYSKDLFINTDGKAFDSWDKLRVNLDDKRILYSNKIDRYEEYRNILYGNHSELKKELKKFSILESKQYQNIPRTIQNVFLSSDLAAEFIKQTIIMSLNEDDVRINLETYNHHLSNFEGQINDINLIKTPAKLEQADTIAKKYVEIRKIEKDKKDLANQLSWTLENNRIRLPELTDEVEERKRQKKEIQDLVTDINTASEQKRLALNARVSILKDYLETIAKKDKFYDGLKINDLILRVAKKQNLVSEDSDLRTEKGLLTKVYNKITDKYEALRKELNSQLEAFIQRKNGERLQKDSGFLTQKSSIQDNHNNAIQDIRSKNAEAVREAHRKVLQKSDAKNNLEKKEVELRHATYFAKEIKKLESELRKLDQSSKELDIQKRSTNDQIKLLQRQGDHEEKNAVAIFNTAQEKHQSIVHETLKEFQAIESKITKLASSLHGWLSDNVTGWESNIGKVCSEHVLFLENLEPSYIENKGANSIYGLQIDLNQIDTKPKTLEDYKKERKAKETTLEQLKTALSDLQKAHSENIDKIKKRFQSKIKEHQDKLYELEYDVEKNKNTENEKKVELSDWETKARSEKEKALGDILTQITAAEQEQRLATGKEAELEKKIKELIKAEEARKANRLKTLTEERDSSFQAIEKDISDKRAASRERELQINKEEQAELKTQGANVKRLEAIEARLELVKKELEYIDEKGLPLVFGYEKDKTELLDNKGKYETEKKELEDKIANEDEKRKKKVGEQTQKLSKVESALLGLEKSLENIRIDSEEFEAFKSTDCFLNIGHHLHSAHNDFVNTFTARQLMDSLKASYYSGITRNTELKEAVNKFLSSFSSGNLFSFRTNLITEIDYHQFATELNDFIAQDRISEFEKRVNERYAEIIKLVGRETTEFTSREGEISKIIRDINDDFEKKNFVGIIQKIELRMDQSTNSIVEILKRIKQFNDEAAGDLGAVNLFSSTDREAKNKKAVDLLKQLDKEIAKSKRDYISLSDSFELKFRVIENHTDTGWVEKISNVGSEGTDILVKAMINIMLLNVFKEGASKRFKDFKLHCVMDEIGKLHPGNVRGLLKFANDRNILLINGSPTENDAMAFRHIYKLEKDTKAMTKVKRIISRLN
jgi:hypothetical protein